MLLKRPKRDDETPITSLQFARSFPEAKQLLGWMRDSKFFNIENKVALFRLAGSDQLRLLLFSRNNYYAIQVSQTYLGCVGGRRNGGGRDMTDGRFSQKTWMRIMMDIFAWEMEDVSEVPELIPA